MDSKNNSDLYQSNADVDTVKIPKNVRQVGNIKNNKKLIYVEDYVVSYTKQLAKREEIGCTIAILVGHVSYNEEGKKIFIKGAIEMECFNSNIGIVMSEEGWTSVYSNIKRYFNDVGVVGWAIIGSEFYVNSDENLRKIHQKNFNGSDRVLLKLNDSDKEEVFYILEQGNFVKQSGYFVYYERNDEMQNYMVETLKASSEEVVEEIDTLSKIREKVKVSKKQDNKLRDMNAANNQTGDKKLIDKLTENTKKEKKQVPVSPLDKENKNEFDILSKESNNQIKNRSGLLYVASTLLLLVVFILGKTIVDNNVKMAQLEKTLQNITETLTVEPTKNQSPNTQVVVATPTAQPLTESEPTNLEVETISSGIITSDNNSSIQNIVSGIIENQISSVEPTKVPEPTKAPEPTKKPDPTKAPEPTKKPEPTKTASSEIKYYTVKEGESLLGISLKLYNSANYIAKIKELNGIDDENKIIIGQKLIVP